METTLAACRRKDGLGQIYVKSHHNEGGLRHISCHPDRFYVPSRAKPGVAPDCGRAEARLAHKRNT